MSTRTQRTNTDTQNAHRDTTTETVQDVTKFLADLLGTTLVAELAAVDVATVRRWSDGVNPPHTANERRLRNAAMISRQLLGVDAAYTVRAWFIGMNPQLGDDAPIDAIAADRFKDVAAAARAFINGA